MSAPAEARVEDLHAAFLDEDVAVVLASIGGNHSNQLLPLLDFDLIRAHPKVFQGYSDVTVLHWAIASRAGLATFYGPALVPELGEFPSCPIRTGTCAPCGSVRERSPSSPRRPGRTSSSTGTQRRI